MAAHCRRWGGDGVYRKTEVGQNIRTSLTQAVSEELRVPPASVRLVMADTDKTPFDMGTFGGRTTPDMNLRLRRVASTARRVLIVRAAAPLGVAVDQLEAKDAAVVHGATSRRVAFDELVKGALLTEVIQERPLRLATAWDVQGQPLKKINGADS